MQRSIGINKGEVTDLTCMLHTRRLRDRCGLQVFDVMLVGEKRWEVGSWRAGIGQCE